MGNLLADQLISSERLKTGNIIDAFRNIDRKDFILPEYLEEVYEDYPLPIGNAQTISQPSTVAFMLELLGPKGGEKILDVGSGSGWATALLAHIVGEEGNVYGVEIIPELVKFGGENLEKYSFSHASIEEAGTVFGLPEKAPFDKILVSASATTIPKELIDQLKVGGLLVVPVGTQIVRIDKISDEKFDTQYFEGFAFVPLIKKNS